MYERCKIYLLNHGEVMMKFFGKDKLYECIFIKEKLKEISFAILENIKI